MSDDPRIGTPKSVRSIWPAVAILVLAVSALVVAQGYSETSRRFPTMVAIALIVLGAIDLYSRFGIVGSRFLNDFWGSGFDAREMTHNPRFRDELALLGWVGLVFLGMAVMGILVATPLFTFLFVWRRSGRGLMHAVLAGLIVLAFEFVVFEWVLNYELYRGLIFNQEGFSAW